MRFQKLKSPADLCHSFFGAKESRNENSSNVSAMELEFDIEERNEEEEVFIPPDWSALFLRASLAAHKVPSWQISNLKTLSVLLRSRKVRRASNGLFVSADKTDRFVIVSRKNTYFGAGSWQVII